MNELALFAGAGGGLLGSKLLGWNTRCAVEIDTYARNVLLARQRDGMLEPFPIWDDIKTFDGTQWRGHIDVISGGFPCQDISSAGKGAGLAGARSGLWFEMLRVIEEVQPEFVFAENSPNLRTRGLGTIIEGLTGLGYDVRWGVLGAWHVGAPHRRNRMWVMARCACANSKGKQVGTAGQPREHGSLGTVLADPDSDDVRLQQGWSRRPDRQSTPFTGNADWWSLDRVPRVAHGVAHKMERIRATGNGQVPAVAALAWTILTEGW